jgi:tRNA G18 (ribose-2'-O)-methylase SpoU
VAFELGAERAGLPPEVPAAADAVAGIPQAAGAESLNVAAAGAIALYELRRRP